MGLKLVLEGTTPWPAASLQHEIPVTSLERWIVLTMCNDLPLKSKDEERTRRELFNQFELDWDFDGKDVNLAAAKYNETTIVKLTRRMVKDLGDLYDKAIEAGIRGRFARAFADLLARLAWSEKAEEVSA